MPPLDRATSPAPAPAPDALGFGIRFHDIYDRDGLVRVDDAFLDALRNADPALAARLDAARDDPSALSTKAESELLIALAAPLETFVVELFGIADAAAALRDRHLQLSPLYSVKRLFVQRRAVHKVGKEALATLDPHAAREALQAYFGEPFSELAFARNVDAWLKDETGHTASLDLAARYAAWAALTPAGRDYHRGGVLFRIPAKLDPLALVPVETQTSSGFARHTLPEAHRRIREGFALTDTGTDTAGALDHGNYCIWCHEQGKDSCSKGLKEKAPGAGFKKSVFGVSLAGCPLEERISEFQLLKARGASIAALAMICVDNPMAAATGHRICNDCMKSCIYQKQAPVDIPQAETRTLKDVLELPWGFEIYSLFTRWNPLNLRRWLPRPATGRKVLVVGLGPAGFTLAHHLMNDGHAVVAIDALKIEPLPATLSGIDHRHDRKSFEPVRDVRSLYESLDERIMAGFGGVAEYGITVRWDKNFLKLVRLLVERRGEFAMFGGVRFGGTLDLEDAWSIGFDHVALCIGAGKPTVLDVPNGLARGVRAASDFLMALQLTGAAKTDSLANMQLRLPVVVIGGGLTAIDAATESLAYYVVQVEKLLARFEALGDDGPTHPARLAWSSEETRIAEEFLRHARALRDERAQARAEQRTPRIAALLGEWGGVTIAYRRRFVDSPSYTLNHEEVEKALEEGVAFAEGLTPVAIETDEYGAASAVGFSGADGAAIRLTARTVLVAAGTQPNTVLAREYPPAFQLDGRYFKACDEDGNAVTPERAAAKPSDAQVLLSRAADGRFVSFFGDVHPSYFGNVVKAMGSAKQGYPRITRVLARRPPACDASPHRFFAGLADLLDARVERVERLTPNIVEVVVRAPLAARKFKPGQFYRLQNYESLAGVAQGCRAQMEGLALTGAWVDRERGLVSTIVLEMGGSSSFCAMLAAGEPVILMGPTGAPTDITPDSTVILCGGGLGNAVLFSIGQALRAVGSRVVYFAGYKKLQDRYKTEEIERAADVVIWCCDEAPGFAAGRVEDKSFVGNIVEAMVAYASGALGAAAIPLAAASRLIAIGSDRMMAAVAAARHRALKPYLSPDHVAVGSINSPMQCMMKEICAQCVQPHIDPVTGAKSYVFSCFEQDQPLDRVDFTALNQRLNQNAVAEKLTALWIRRMLPDLERQRARV